MTTEIRCAIECRDDDDMASPGRLTGTLIRYGERAGAGRAELFERDSLTWDPAGIVLTRQHAKGAPIMRVVPDRSGRRRGDRRGVAGFDRWALGGCRGSLRSPRASVRRVSRAALQSYQGGVRRIKRAALVGAGLVWNPEYAGSRVEVRSGGAGRGGVPWL